MKEDKRELLKAIGVFSSVGLSFVIAIFIGVMIGLKLDKWLGTAPWFFFIFMLFGIAAGFRNLFHFTNRMKRDKNGKDE